MKPACVLAALPSRACSAQLPPTSVSGPAEPKPPPCLSFSSAHFLARHNLQKTLDY